jgi:shikimate dehydrogenase
LGLHATDPLPLDAESLEPGSAFCDIIAVRDTEIMAHAQARGCRVIGGRPMVDHQIAAQIDFLDPPALAT